MTETSWLWRCFFGIHYWPKWSDPKTMQTTLDSAHAIQLRSCAGCNRAQARSVVVQEDES